MRVLLLEDEFSLRISIKEFLEDIDYSVDDFADGLEAHDAIYAKSYDLLLLDINVPSMSGFELLQSIRKDGIKIPAIFLTSMTELQGLKEGYRKGCCDYIRKPFDLLELELRIKQAIRSYYLDNSDMVELGEGFVYDMLKGKLTKDDKEIVLRKIEKDLLEMLIKNKNSVVSMQMFQDEVWGDYVEPSAIRVQINNLKQKLSETIIHNRRGLGYIIER
ncbi:two component transcriptional regulator, winged helix family [Sulfurimonas denitrificans DSM 1251]|uniref:Two component transcriptional regulator, winged helix family n=1 Tax=Sulfurimonas denitrificans (strain ATCC 33889 / DSM 1251) TaxID=326298 RepID=Q30TZ2_SULDN|nr:response regulator transcription factor [Sulfurimonas denitrificans]ABB43539.1 two component transcriptional regulator, winged helix family [Sulfurimonas denitrificans DSM 1251]